MNREQLLVVAEDLQFLADWGSDIAAADIRRGSATLRRILVEGAYGNAWRAAGFGKEPSVIAIDIAKGILPEDLKKVAFMLAVGVEFRGLLMGIATMNKGDKPVPIVHGPSIRADGYPGERIFKLSEYIGSPSAYVEGEWISRSDVIKYIANVRGGVHLSASQQRRESVLVQRLGPIVKGIVIDNTEGLLVELVAIAQTVGRSEDAQAFCASLGLTRRSSGPHATAAEL